MRAGCREVQVELPFGGVMDVAFIGSTAYALVSVVGSEFPDGPVRLSPPNRRDLPRGRAYELDRRRGHRHVCVRATRRPGSRSPSQRESSTRWRRIAADSSSRTDTTTACFASRSTARSRRLIGFGGTSSRPGWRYPGTRSTWQKPVLFRMSRRTARSSRSSQGRRLRRTSRPALDSPWTWRWAEDGRCSPSRRASSPVAAIRRAPELRRHTTPERSCGRTETARFTTIADELDQPSSLEIIGNTAYVVTLGGEVWTIDNVAGPPYGGNANTARRAPDKGEGVRRPSAQLSSSERLRAGAPARRRPARRTRPRPAPRRARPTRRARFRGAERSPATPSPRFPRRGCSPPSSAAWPR